MVTIRDQRLQTHYTALQNRFAADPGTRVDAAALPRLLSAVADNSRFSAAQMEARLSAPGITRQQQVDLVKGGMSAGEKRDLESILDTGNVPMTDEVKSFIRQVLGRDEVVPNDGALRVSGNQAGGVIKGTVKAGSQIEVINLSTAPNKRLRMDDTFVAGNADATGRFSASLPDMKEGDVIRMRARDADGTTGNWVTVRATGVGAADTRNAEVALFRFGISDAGNGKLNLFNINKGRPISEPGAQVQVVNTRTQEKVTLRIGDDGDFPAGAQLPGRPGDKFSVRVSDGTTNANFATEAGTVEAPGVSNENGGVNLPDPALHKDELNADGTPKFQAKRYTGPLFVNGARPEDVKQGQIGNCYLPAAIASLAHTHAGALQNMIKDNGNGTYTVTFKERDWRTNSYKDKPITVDADLYSRTWGGPLYGASAGNTSTTGMELWWPILEKAYAQFKGSYNTIGDGGVASSVFTDVLGRSSNDMSLRWDNNPDKVWNRIKSSLDAGLPVAAGTYGKEEAARYTNTGVYSNHAYSVLGYEERDGVKYVKLRNPWGESEPVPGDGRNDGVFNLKLDDFLKLYQSLYAVR